MIRTSTEARAKIVDDGWARAPLAHSMLCLGRDGCLRVLDQDDGAEERMQLHLGIAQRSLRRLTLGRRRHECLPGALAQHLELVGQGGRVGVLDPELHQDLALVRIRLCVRLITRFSYHL